jgi:peptide/nickel transport system permease protein
LLNLQQMLFPALVLGFGLAAPIMRTARASLLEVSNADFMRTARGKGVAPGRLRTRHLLHNALNPIVTMTGIQFGYLLGGAVVVEQIFSVPGIGRQVLVGMQQKEFAVVQSTVLVIAATFVLVNLLTDLAYRLIDPRVRAS